jgi:nucleotide-binding universal stress UspA family protein
MNIVAGVDGSLPSKRAVEWCAAHAAALAAEVVAVHALELPVFVASSAVGSVPLRVPAQPDRDQIRELMQREWCASLNAANVPCRSVVTDGPPAAAIIAIAEEEAADLVVTGRRGLGGFAEPLLGSTTHLAHHVDRPLLIIP